MTHSFFILPWGRECPCLSQHPAPCMVFNPTLLHGNDNHRADSRLAPSQWDTSLQSNTVSHRLSANLEPALLSQRLIMCLYPHDIGLDGEVIIHVSPTYNTCRNSITRDTEEPDGRTTGQHLSEFVVVTHWIPLCPIFFSNERMVAYVVACSHQNIWLLQLSARERRKHMPHVINISSSTFVKETHWRYEKAKTVNPASFTIYKLIPNVKWQ